MIRVLALTRYGRLGASSRLRTFQYQPLLAEHGVEFDIRSLFGDDYLEALYGRKTRAAAALGGFWRRFRIMAQAQRYDAVWVEKETLPYLPFLVESSLIPGNVPLILDFDDAVFHRYDMHPSVFVRSLLGRKLDRLMARADLVIAGNDYLADRARLAGCPRVEIVPTVVDIDRYPLPQGEKRGCPLRVGWIGSPSTAHYLQPLVPLAAKLASEEGVAFTAIGPHPDQLAGTAFRVIPWSEGGEAALIANLDVGIMPLPDTPWERGKCGYKLIQYMACGRPVIASSVGVNRRLVDSGVNGFLAKSEDDWIRAIRCLRDDPLLRSRFGVAGRRKVELAFSLQVQGPRLAKLVLSCARNGMSDIGVLLKRDR